MDGVDVDTDPFGMRSYKVSRVAALLAWPLIFAACATAPSTTSIPLHSSAAPTAPPRLLVRLNVGGGWPGAYGQHVADYLSDGTVIRVNGGTLERNRLTETGLASLRTTLATSADLLATPLQIAPLATELPVDDTRNMPQGISELVNTFILERPDGSRYAVSAPSRHAGDMFASVRDPVVESLTALADALTDPTTLVGAGGLADPDWRTFRATETAVFFTLQEASDHRVVSDGVIPQIGPADWPFKGAPHTFGNVFQGPGDHVIRRCAFLASPEADTAIASLSKVGGQRAAGEIASGYMPGAATLSSGLTGARSRSSRCRHWRSCPRTLPSPAWPRFPTELARNQATDERRGPAIPAGPRSRWKIGSGPRRRPPRRLPCRRRSRACSRTR
jgi:hypothetical protein